MRTVLLRLGMAQLRALIFDVDGTLADTERDGHRVAFNQAFAISGLDWQWSIDLYRDLIEQTAGGKERILAYREHHHPTFTPDTDLKTFAAQLHQLKTAQYKRLLMAGTIPLRPGVQRLLKEALEQGIRLAIATTSAPANAIALLEQTLGKNSLSWFEVIAAGDIVPAKKPAPDIYQYVLQILDLPASDCLAIEDSQQGLLAAHLAGLSTVVTVNPYTQHQDFAQAALVLDHLGEPDCPFTVLAGEAKDATYFDIALARTIVASPA